MVAIRSLFLVVLSFLWTFTRGDTELSCTCMKSCIMLCSFQPSQEIVIHWVQLPGDRPVHSYYHGQDQLTYQNERFKGRTSLFKEQISRGNASLLLSNVQLQDKARYKCYISTTAGNKESYISMTVEAPVTTVHLQQVENRLICSSEGIYPEPGLSWSTNPPSSTTSNTTVQQTEQLLYNISSSLMLSQDATDVDYSCTVSSTNSKTAMLFKLTSISGSDTQTIPCAASTTPLTSVIWRFNHSQVIVDDNGRVSEEWRPYVEEVTDSGSLMLKLSSSDRDGIYTCELTNAETTHITNTFLEYKEDSNTRTTVIVGVVVGVLAAIIVVIVVIVLPRVNKKKITAGDTKESKTQEECAPLEAKA